MLPALSSYLIREHVGMFKLTDTYDIFDAASGQQLAVAKEKKGLLNSTGDPEADYSMLSQIASHELFAWSVVVIKQLYMVVIESDPGRAPMFRPFLSSFDPIWFERMHLTEPTIEGPLQS